MADLSNALLSLGLPAEQIASRSGLPLERVQAILQGESPKVSELRALGTSLRLPARFFGRKSEQALNGELQLQFRSTGKSAATFNPTVERVAAFIDAALTLLPPRHHFPEVLRNGEAPQPDQASAWAEQCRAFLEFDASEPLYSLPSRVGSTDGVVVSIISDSRFEGVSVAQSNYLFIFVSPRFQGRMLFTLAHEIGHALAGHLAPGRALFEGASSIGNYRKSQKNERFADAFAGHFLLPDDALMKFVSFTRAQLGIAPSAALGDIEILLLARFFGVSFEVAANRCEGVGILPKGGGFSIAEHLRKHHKSPERRADELGLPPRQELHFPTLNAALADAINTAIEEGSISIGWASDRFGLSLSEIVGNRAKRLI